MTTTIDDFLGGKIRLKQPQKGYRITSDSVYLAASISLKSGEKILDIGSGTGAILSCLTSRLAEHSKNITMHGIELQDELITIARENSKLNDYGHNIEYFKGDIFSKTPECPPNSYHHVVSNPPYYEKGTVSQSPYETKAVAHGKGMIDIQEWVTRSLRMVHPKGFLTLVHRADRLDDILTALNPKTGNIIIFPLFSKEGKDANRVIIRAQKDGKGVLTLKSGLIVHKSDGNYTENAENILRHAEYLDISK